MTLSGFNAPAALQSVAAAGSATLGTEGSASAGRACAPAHWRDCYVYHAAANESFDGVALAIYGDEKYARELMLANPELSGQFVFDGGEVLLLPQIEIPVSNSEAALANTIAPWKM